MGTKLDIYVFTFFILYGSWIYNYLCNQRLSPLMLRVQFTTLLQWLEKKQPSWSWCKFVCLMVFNATFNNISVISWRSVLLVEETGGSGENHRPVQVTDKLYRIMLYNSPLIVNWTRNISGDRRWLWEGIFDFFCFISWTLGLWT
jgi:hypothetical protein